MAALKVTGVQRLLNKLEKFEQKLPWSSTKSIEKALQIGQNKARELAPQQTGSLKANIKKSKVKKEGDNYVGILSSSVNSPFPYNRWVNRMTGYKRISGRYPFFRHGQDISYGQMSARAPSGKPIKWTGTAGYFNLTVEHLRKEFPKISISNVRNVMIRSGFK